MTNRTAFLDTIGFSEGTSTIPGSDNGYNVLVGATPQHPLLFTDYSDHPRVYNAKMNSTAAGRYQILERYYDIYKAELSLEDFSPASQDAIALQMIKEHQALRYIDDGEFELAIVAVAHIWASFPGAGYGQHENDMVTLKQAYLNAGGTSV